MRTCSPLTTHRAAVHEEGIPNGFRIRRNGHTMNAHMVSFRDVGSTVWGAALLLFTLSTFGCAYYGFSGANIPSHLETIAIPIAEDNTSNPVPTLDRDLTNRLTDQFVSRTGFSLENNEPDADAVLTARIRRYSNQPTGVSGDERATRNRVQIDVDIRYYDQVRDSTMLSQTFTGSENYDPNQSGLNGERQAAQVAIERVAEDIFTSATSNW